MLVPALGTHERLAQIGPLDVLVTKGPRAFAAFRMRSV